ncbi:MAG: Ldh family oxidoreductase [Proteobacteria bacterium]|nr:Ldh family oxidoreductase [Pseudomonadota bacterium]
MINISDEILCRQIISVLTRWGMSAAYAETAATVMVDTDLHGIDSHGIGMLPAYQLMHSSGRMDVKAQFEVVKDFPSIALIDGNNGLGHPASVHAMEMAIEKAGKTGIGVVSVRHSNHYGAAGYYARMASDRGMIGISMTSTPGTALVPTFGREGKLGTNPIAFSAPAEESPPFLLDMATTTVAVGKVTIAKRLGKEMPIGWAVDQNGNPTTDANLARELRLLTPLGGSREVGGHKGYGLAAMVEILCCTLSGSLPNAVADPTLGPDTPLDVGHFFLALDPSIFRDDDNFGGELDALIGALRGTKPTDPAQPVLVAGDPERAAYAERTVTGIPISDALLEEVRSVTEAADVPFIMLSNH